MWSIRGFEPQQRRARLGVEEVKASRIHGQPDGAAHTCRRPRIDPRVQERPALDHEIRGVVLLPFRRVDGDAGRVDPEEDVRVRAELLEHDGLGVQGG